VSGAARWLPLLAVAALAAAFASLNRGERVVVELGLATFYRVPLTGLVFVAFVAGMGAMMLLSLRHDLALRRELRARSEAPAVAVPPAAPAPAAVTEEDDRTIMLPADPPASERRAHAEDAEDPERI
jgi:hypothetical protein